MSNVMEQFNTYLNDKEFIRALDLLFEEADELGPIDTRRRWRECFIYTDYMKHLDQNGETVITAIPFFLACWKMVREVQDNYSIADKYRNILKNWLDRIEANELFFKYALDITEENESFLNPSFKLKAYIYIVIALLDLEDRNFPEFINNLTKSICLLGQIPYIKIPQDKINQIELLKGYSFILESAFGIIQNISKELQIDTVVFPIIDEIRLICLWLLRCEIPVLRSRSVSIPHYKHISGEVEISLLTVYLLEMGKESIFPHPILNSFCVYDARFRESMENSVYYILSHPDLKKEWGNNCISWRITERKQEALPAFPIVGSIWGAGISVALKSLLAGYNIDPDCCIIGSTDKNGKIKPVPYIVEKIDAARKSGKIHTVIVPSNIFQHETPLMDNIRSRIDDGYYSPIKVEYAADIDEATNIASGINSMVLKYFESMEKKLERLPSYYPDNYKFDRVRINVKVSEERIREENWEAVQNEIRRRMGEFTDNDMGKEPTFISSPYSHVRGEETLMKAMEQEKEIAIFEWDEKAGEKPENKRLIILGDPGFGKTFLLKYEGLRILRESRKDIIKGKGLSSIVFPIFIRLTDIASCFHQDVGGIQFKDNICNVSKAKGTHPVVEVIVDSISKHLGIMSEKDLEGFKDFVRGKMEAEKCVLLLDALDEVPSNLRDKLRGEISSFSSSHKYTNPRILLSSRIVGYHSPPPVHNAKEVELLAFDSTQMEKFVNAWFGDNWIKKAGQEEGQTEEEKDEETSDSHRESSDVIRRSAREIMQGFQMQPDIMGMCRVPLILSFVCKLIHSGILTSLTNKKKLFSTVVLVFLRDWKKEKDETGQLRVPNPMVIEDQIILLKQIANNMMRDRKQQCSRKELLQYIRDSKSELLSELGAKHQSTILKKLENDGIFIQSGSSVSSPYLWLHTAIFEFFADLKDEGTLFHEYMD